MHLNDCPVGSADHTMVGELTTHFGVEGGAVKDDFNFCRSTGCRGGQAVNKQGLDNGLASLIGVADEVRAATHLLFNVAEHPNVSVAGLLGASISARTFLLLIHERAETSFVDLDALFGRHF